MLTSTQPPRCADQRDTTVLARYIKGNPSSGWSCGSAGTEVSCARGGAEVGYGEARNVRRCATVVFTPNTEDGAFSVQAKWASCRLARRVARGSRNAGPTHPSPYSKSGFRCRGETIHGATLPTALYTCRRGRATIVFDR